MRQYAITSSLPSITLAPLYSCTSSSYGLNVPSVATDGTFKPYDELVQLYKGAKVIDGKDEVIAYCRIGERSSHTWFALKYLLGVKKVRNYDGSWTEWGNLVGAPIAKGAE